MTESSFYPISLDEIETKVARKNGRRNGWSSNGGYQFSLPLGQCLDNVKEIVNEFGERITRVDGDIPADLSVNDGDRFLFISYDQSALTHGLHRYPAKFFPELPRWLVKRYSNENDLVLDPFSGSGTTNIEALLLRRHSVGIDVDPFSRFLSKVKATPLDESELKSTQERLLRFMVNYQPSKVFESDIPCFPYRDNWFNREIILEVAYLKKTIEALDASNDVKDFFKICLSSIIRAVSNADDNCTRTVIRKKLNKRVYPSDALKRFAEVVLFNVPKMIEFSQRCLRNVAAIFPEDMDARSIRYEEENFDLAVTSPPYANAVDYPRTHQLESYWSGLANGSLTPLKKKHVGTESVSSNEYKQLHKIGIDDADIVISEIFEKDPRRAYIAFKYLDDMRKNLTEAYRVLKTGARYIIVVGNNRIRGELFENWKYIMELAKGVGFELETYFASEIIKYFIKVPREERINTDWILVLRK
ncbi:DNA methyltransferase [Candidatus Hakubella thermalkaliphila]|nr:DNA methyltransferase [Candidatus Hakubella thermalkaliphila]